MALPKSVQTQAEKASQFFEQDENPGDDTPPAPDAEPKNKEGTPAAESQEDTATPPDDKAQDAEPPKHEPDQDALYWRHRYDVLQGKYNKEVPALHQEVKQLKQDIADKDARIVELEQAGGQGQPGQLSDDKLKQMRVDFGDDLVDAMLDLARSGGGGGSDEVARLRQELDEIRQKEQQREQETLEDAKARFWSTLEAQVPQWREINASPAFHQFLAQPDERTGQPRQKTLEAAQQALDPAPVVTIFRSYQQQAGAQQTPPAPNPDDVEPPRSRASDPAPQGQGGAIWTGAKIRQFYEDKRRGRYSKDEAARLEADIFAAQQEGRVR